MLLKDYSFYLSIKDNYNIHRLFITMKLLRFHGWVGENIKGIVLRKVLKNCFSNYQQLLAIIHGLSAFFSTL